MEASIKVILAVLPIFLIIGFGALARLVGWLNESADKSLTKLIINLLYPALIFSFVLGSNALRKPENLILPPIFGFGTVIVGFAVSLAIAKLFKIGSSEERRTFAFTTGIYNYSYFTIPIVGMLFNNEAIGILLVFNLGVEIAVWLFGVGFVLSPMNAKSFLGRLINGPVIAVILAVSINYFQFDQKIPGFLFEILFKVIRMLGQCAIPLGLILIGAIFMDLRANISSLTRIKIPLSAIFLRLAVLPAIFLAAAFFVQPSTGLAKVIVVQAAMPCAVFPIVLVSHFGGSTDIAFKSVLSTILLSLITIPLWIKAGISLFGL